MICVIREVASIAREVFWNSDALRQAGPLGDDVLGAEEQVAVNHGFESPVGADEHVRGIAHPLLLELEADPVVDIVADVLLVGEHLVHRVVIMC
jgi:hypothetical protein